MVRQINQVNIIHSTIKLDEIPRPLFTLRGTYAPWTFLLIHVIPFDFIVIHIYCASASAACVSSAARFGGRRSNRGRQEMKSKGKPGRIFGLFVFHCLLYRLKFNPQTNDCCPGIKMSFTFRRFAARIRRDVHLINAPRQSYLVRQRRREGKWRKRMNMFKWSEQKKKNKKNDRRE